MKTRIFNLIILDESGSMSAIEQEAISGVNETIQTIRSAQKSYEDQLHFITLVSFNSDSIKTIYDCVEIGIVEELTNKEYTPSCCTPLYDAMGSTLTRLKKTVAEVDKVLVTVITDGYENDSHEYTGDTIKKLVENLKQRGWVFTYIGANQNAQKAAFNIAINNVMNFQTTSTGTKAMFAKENRSRMNWFTKISEGCQNISEDFFEDKNI